MTEPTKLFGLTPEKLNAYLNAISQKSPKSTLPKQQSSVKLENKTKVSNTHEYFYDISTNLFIG